MLNTGKFDKNQSNEFILDLKHSVDDYLKKKNKSKHGDWNMFLKSIFMLLLYFVPYTVTVTRPQLNPWTYWLMWVLMGLGTIGIGFAISHDASHGAYSKHKLINKLFGISLNIIGGNEKSWHIQHNRLHHTFTNIYNMDPDLNQSTLLRLSPETPLKKIHKHQHIYAWFLYCFTTLAWLISSDFERLYDFKKHGIINNQKYRSLLIDTTAWKIIYYLYMFIIPYFFVGGISFLFWLTCFLTLHIMAGITFAAVFHVGHLMPQCDYPNANKEGIINNSWAAHQLQTTSNFSTSNKLLSWFFGGLNFQIEHHLFPTMCHTHYQAISHLVREKAQKYGLPYYSQKTFIKAMIEHTRMLKSLSRENHMPPG